MIKFNKENKTKIRKLPYLDIEDNKIVIDDISRGAINATKRRLKKLEKKYPNLNEGLRKSLDNSYKELKKEIKRFNSNYDTFNNMIAELEYASREFKGITETIKSLDEDVYSKDFRYRAVDLLVTATEGVYEGYENELDSWEYYIEENYTLDNTYNLRENISKFLNNDYSYQNLYYNDAGTGVLNQLLDHNAWSTDLTEKAKKMLEEEIEKTKTLNIEGDDLEIVLKNNKELKQLHENLIPLRKYINKYR